MTTGHNLIVDVRVKQDILAYTPPLRHQIITFMRQLADNPYSPSIIQHSVQVSESFYYHRLPSGCFIFWEIVYLFTTPSIGTLTGVVVRVIAARFDFDPRATIYPVK